jgi:uncharacterized protein (TIGR00251 family)
MLEALREQLAREKRLDLVIRVRPGAPRSKFVSTLTDGSLKIDVAEAAEAGKANLALVRFLAESFGVERSTVEVLSGKTSRRKLVRIQLPGG